MDVAAAGEFLRTVRPLARFADADLAPLAARMRERRLRPGQILAKEGAHGAEMFFVRRGTLAIVKGITGGVEQIVARIGAGEFVGEMALFDRRPRSATMRAETEVELLVLDRKAVAALVNMSPGAAAAFLRALSEEFIERLRRSNQLIAELTCAVLEATGFKVEAMTR
ncbi:MAG: cyclic nucleotide-binding domain-containing protein [Candidatus Rokubacteria bacterium]|nr:cyclic nucleotide-binding domain-containing protein [Candidatus Rokubacteria bacterium]